MCGATLTALGVDFALQNSENASEYTRPDAEASACVEAATATEQAHAATQMRPTEARKRTLLLPRVRAPSLAGAHSRKRPS
jgi:hypothetical protein